MVIFLRKALNCVCLAAIAAVVTSCTSASLPSLEDARSSGQPVSYGARKPASDNHLPLAGKSFKGDSYAGTGKLFGDASTRGQEPALPDIPAGDGLTLNLVGVSIPEASKAILGDLFGMNYAVAGGLEGTVTIQTSRPASSREIFALFNGALRENNAMLERGVDGIWQVRRIPENEGGSVTDVVVSREAQDAMSATGLLTQVVPLQYVAASELEKVLTGIIADAAKISVEQGRNALLVTGKPEDIRTALEIVQTFDVDWMKGMSFGLFPVKVGSPETVVAELNQVFGSAGKASARFIPNKRLQAVLVIAPKFQEVERAREWISRLDAAAASTEPQTFVYKVQNRQAKELATILQEVFSETSNATVSASETPVSPQENMDASAQQPESNASMPEPSSEIEISADTDVPVRIVPDDANNSLIIVATAQQYERIQKALERIDFVPQQVLLEATIAEVALTDELKFGLKWFFEKNASSAQFSNLANGAVSSVFPGFNYLFAGDDAKVALSALSSITDVNVVSSPTLMVLDNRTAILQVGDQVPVATQSAVSTSNPDSPVVNTIELKDTGIILSVTPRVSDNGSVLLDIEQEVSDVVPTTTSGIDSPTIQQRKIRTSVVVRDGSTLALGGLIQRRNKDIKSGVPVASTLPLVGALFRAKTSDEKRTELIILITPRVAWDATGAAVITQEFQRGMKSLSPNKTGKPNAIPNHIQRIVN
jgi:general secretion pathway protein D